MTPSSVTLKVAAVVHRSRWVVMFNDGSNPPERGLRGGSERRSRGPVTGSTKTSQDAWDVFVDNGQVDDPDTHV